MPFTPKDWADGSVGATPITAAELERIEAGVADGVSKAEAAVPTASHTKAAHDNMGINADTVDGAHAADLAPVGHGHATDAPKSSVAAVVTHDGTAGGGTRPSGYGLVIWVSPIGSDHSRPTNATSADLWVHDAA